MSEGSRSEARKSTGASLSTFGGVFVPSFLTIIGIIFFMRLGYVTGQAGLFKALLIIALANSISILTSLSMAAVATNLRVKSGGVYYIISRTLGPMFGGSIGIVLYLAQSVSIGFYCIGFGELLAGILPHAPLVNVQSIAAAAVLVLFALALMGADWSTKFQYVVLIVVTLSITAFAWGVIDRWDTGLLLQNWAAPAEGPGFWIMFAIFFPAVTGFTQGVNMSGDLKDPGRSIPLGTFLAVGLTSLLYLGGAIGFAGTLPLHTLQTDYTAMQRISPLASLVDAGIIAATLSSAMASFLGGPRVLQSLAGDKIFPFLHIFHKGHGTANNPRRAVMLSALIALGTIGLGDLNVVAPVVTMFFMVTYVLLNYATFYEARSQSPMFRPRFRWHTQTTSMAGWIVCFIAMIAIDLTSGILAVAIVVAIYNYLQRTVGPSRWADSRRSYYLQRLRDNLLAAANEPQHPRDWRPQTIVFSDDPHRRERLVRFASWISGKSGAIAAVRIIQGDEGLRALREKMHAEKELQVDVAQYSDEVFSQVVTARDMDQAFFTILQSFGVGPLRVNTIIVNWMEKMSVDSEDVSQLLYGRNLRKAHRMGCNIIIFHAGVEEWGSLVGSQPHERRLDVWWKNDATSRLMLLLAHLMKRSMEWENATLRLLSVPEEAGECGDAECLEKMLEEARIDAQCVIIPATEFEGIAHHSRDASLVFIPFKLIDTRVAAHDGGKIQDLLPGLPPTAMVLAAESIELDAEPEEGAAAAAAAIRDQCAQAEARAQNAEKDAELAAQAAKEKETALQEAQGGETDEEELERLRSEAKAAAEEALRTARRAAKAAVLLEHALQDLKDLQEKEGGTTNTS